MSKDIWYTPPQTPDVFKSHPIIVVYEAGDQIEQMDSKEYSDLVGERYVNRWCYVDDLLVLETENEDLSDKIGKLETELERTHKALDVAKKGLKELKDIIACPPDISYETCVSMYADGVLQEITALEQKDK